MSTSAQQRLVELTPELHREMLEAEAEIAGLKPEDLPDIKNELNGRVITKGFGISVGSEVVRAVVAFEDPARVKDAGVATGGTIIAPGVTEQAIRGYAITQGRKNRMALGATAVGKKMGVDVNPNNLSDEQEDKLFEGLLRGLYDLGIEIGNGPGMHRIGPDRNCTHERMDKIVSATMSVYGLSEAEARSAVTGKSMENGGHLGRPMSTGYGAAAGADRLLSLMGVSRDAHTSAYQMGLGEASYPYLLRIGQLRPNYATKLLGDHTELTYFPEGIKDLQALWQAMHEGEINLGLEHVSSQDLARFGGRFVNSDDLVDFETAVSRTLASLDVLVPAAKERLIGQGLLDAMTSLEVCISIANRPYASTELLRRLELTGGIDARDYVINSGGIRISDKEADNPNGVTPKEAQRHILEAENGIVAQVQEIVDTARKHKVPFGVAADGISLRTDVQSIA